jgi:hypothetical protein
MGRAFVLGTMLAAAMACGDSLSGISSDKFDGERNPLRQPRHLNEVSERERRGAARRVTTSDCFAPASELTATVSVS